MKNMRITSQVRAAFERNDPFGWHILKGDDYHTFDTRTAQVIIDEAKWQGWTFVGYNGNGLHFKK